ncbi:metallophosphoesterase [Aetokthonos hydrillicola Thurmond2011]|jgi:3',5'-cyclic AMP phosphodiesterase CpdA|uniref:Metallophosphoesterase n=1 Tax=Aetokthonos hydrillicola Thurmond2011 TaxID=2712845 RepID=A0AAP5ICW3_9CYAN|nr:metallophosphoesterase [Aetokthonos hydrillicola]MBW4585802.1 metallophosphoesterase [Aetokthonos hydrillicola CCALA 1050]MDR9899305.1 metallophosphoesterase [Aetokthonos hydrillicola Thurmond2011]
MNFKRRQFLFFSSLSAIGIGFLGCVAQQSAKKADTATAVPAQQDLLLRFVSVADTGTGGEGQYAVAKAMTNYHSQKPYDLVILAGDNIYTNGEIEKISEVFERPYAPLLKQGVKFQACLGNHDIRTANGDPQVKYPQFNMSGRYYTFSQGQVQFFALDTNGNADWKNQLVWLEQELSRSNALWKVVFGHHPVYASGIYGSNPSFIKTFTPLFTKYKVQLYINGHEHHYERTRSINGTTYLITGGGAATRPVRRSEWTEYSASKLSFASYEVYKDRIETSAIGTDNRVFDKGIIKLHSA